MEIQDLQKGAFKGAFWKFSERILAQLVSFVVSVVLARILSPDDYSVVGIVAIFFTFSNVLISGGFNSALIQKKEADDLDYASVLWLTFSTTALAYALLFFCAPVIASLYHKPILVPVVRVMGLNLFVNSYKSILTARISSQLQFRKFFFATIVGTICSAIIGIAMARKGFGPWALVAQQMSNSLIDTILLAVSTHFCPLFRFSRARIRSLFSFGGKIYLASLINVIYDEIKPLIVGIRFSPTDLAFYNKGESFPKILNSSITETLSSVLFPVISKVQDDMELVKRVTRRYMSVTSYVLFPVMIGFLAVSKQVILLLLTEKWLPCVPYVQIFCITYMFNIIQSGNLQAIRAIGRSDTILKLEIIKKTLYLIVIALFVLFSPSPIILALSGLITAVIASLINAFPNRKYIRYGYRQQIQDLLPNLLSAVAMGAAVWAMNYIPLNRTLLLVIQILSGCVLYVLISILTKNSNFNYLLNVIRQTARR